MAPQGSARRVERSSAMSRLAWRRLPWRRLCAVAFWIGIFVTFGLAMISHPSQIGEATSPAVQAAVEGPLTINDKAQHLLVFGTLTALALTAWPRVWWVWVLVGLSAYGGLIEIVQGTTWIGGDAEWGDWLADTGAVVIVITLRRFRPFVGQQSDR